MLLKISWFDLNEEKNSQISGYTIKKPMAIRMM